MPGNNRVRVFAEVLAIDAWHKPDDRQSYGGPVHVEVSFQQGRLAGDYDDLPFTFTVGLKRALLTVRVEEPLSIDRNTVARNIPKNNTEFQRKSTLKTSLNNKAGVDGTLNANIFDSKLSAAISESSSKESTEELSWVDVKPSILAVAKPISSKEYSWVMTPGITSILDGQPWDPVSEPRFNLNRVQVNSVIEPVISVTVSCKFEDIVIDDIKGKNDSFIEKLRRGLSASAREKAIVQFLKLALLEANLEFGTLDNRFSEIIIAEVLADLQK